MITRVIGFLCCCFIFPFLQVTLDGPCSSLHKGQESLECLSFVLVKYMSVIYLSEHGWQASSTSGQKDWIIQSRFMFITGTVPALAKVNQKGTEPLRCALDMRADTSFGDVDKQILVSVAISDFQGEPNSS